MRFALLSSLAIGASAGVLQSLEAELFPQAQEVGLAGASKLGNCLVTSWSAWGDCSKTCGVGTQSKHRAGATKIQPKGCLMPALTEERWCNTKSCALLPASSTPLKKAEAGVTTTLLADLVPLQASVGWGTFWANRNWYQRGFTIAGRHFDTGVFAHAPSDLHYDLGGRFSEFSACAGLDDGNASCGDGANFRVIMDGKQIWKKTVRGGETAQCFRINVRGANKLRLVVDMGADNKCDEAEWVDAKLFDDFAVDCVALSTLVPSAKSIGWGSGFTDPAWAKHGFRIGGQLYREGVGAHARSELHYPLRAQYDVLTTCAGLDDSGGNCGDGAIFAAKVDGRTRWTARVKSGDAAKCTKIALGGAQTLQLSVDPLKDNNCDMSEWVNTFVCRKKASTTPVDCVVAPWSEWGVCSMSCGHGWATRERIIERSPQNGGKHCPALSENKACNTKACPSDCILRPWGKWSTCTRTCNIGHRTRVRSVRAAPQHGGRACGALTQTRTCSSGKKCPVACTMAAWGSWSKCSRTCGEGNNMRVRKVLKAAVGNGYCPPTTESRICVARGCVSDCKVSRWTAWSKCTKTCGNGHRKRSREILHPNLFSGRKCPPLMDVERCNTEACPVNCKLSGWESWTGCSTTCGGGVSKRTRSEEISPSFGGWPCGRKTETRACNVQHCPVNCVVSRFASYSRCSVTCGGGARVRMRSIVEPSAFGGDPCPHREEQQRCNLHACPVNCEVSEWRAGFWVGSGDIGAVARKTAFKWSPCSKTCGTGVQTRVRTVVRSPAFDGVPCPRLSESRACRQPACFPDHVDCRVSAWTGYSQCSKGCGGGVKERQRLIETAPQFGGRPCPSVHERAACNAQVCPVHCSVANFGDWTPCDRTCGSGQRVRTRAVAVASRQGGNACPALVLVVACNTQPCPADCEVRAWSEWSQCSLTCGTGSQSRKRTILAASQTGGKMCPQLTQTRRCNEFACPVDCKLGQFGQWSPCSKTCGGGRQNRVRRELRPASAFGAPCPHRAEERWCKTKTCPVDCELSYWGPWSECVAPKGCGQGSRVHERIIVAVPAFGGKKCGPLKAVQKCDAGPCAKHCEVTKWSVWTPCTQSCGGGAQTRMRHVVRKAMNGGARCPVLVQQLQCHMVPCAVDCKLSQWGAWSTCPRTCGGGEQFRMRQVLRRPTWMGKECGAMKQRQACAVASCPVDCETSIWLAFAPCTKMCGGGQQSRKRKVLVATHFGGKSCGKTEETVACNQQHCAVDCNLVVASAWGACNKSCGRGHQVRRRIVARHPKFGGKPCPPLVEARWCNTHACPVDCKPMPWSPWGACARRWDHKCVKARGRGILVAAANGGMACKFTTHDEEYCPSKSCEGNEKCTHLTCHVVTKDHRGKACTPSPNSVNKHGQPTCAPVMEIRHQGVKRCNARAHNLQFCKNDALYHPELRESKEAHTGHHCQRTGSARARTCDCHCYNLPPKPEEVVTPRVAAP